MPNFTFNSIAEIMEFVGCLTAKAKKSGKGDDADAGAEQAAGNSPQPMAPPTGAQAGAGFGGGPQGFTAPPAAGAAQAGGAFPALAAPAAGPQLAPEVVAWLQKIGTVIDQHMAGPKAAEMLQWFRSNCGAEAANATADQIKGIFLPRFSVEQLAGIGKMMGIT